VWEEQKDLNFNNFNLIKKMPKQKGGVIKQGLQNLPLFQMQITAKLLKNLTKLI